MIARDFIVDRDDGLRLDRFLALQPGSPTRSQLKERVANLTVNGRPVKLSHTVFSGDVVHLEYNPPPEPVYQSEFLPLDIVFENDEVIVVNKPSGIVVHPAAGNHSGTLVQGLMYHVKELSDRFSGDVLRPGIVHRLDKDTSGVIIAAKSPEALEFLANQFRQKQVKKTYLALVKGMVFPPEGYITKRLLRHPVHRKRYTWSDSEGREAKTAYRVLRQYEDGAFVALRPETGRTHQLRVHMLSQGHPIIGDPVYARKPDPRCSRLMLHAYVLSILLPGESSPRRFTAPLPEDFRESLVRFCGHRTG